MKGLHRTMLTAVMAASAAGCATRARKCPAPPVTIPCQPMVESSSVRTGKPGPEKLYPRSCSSRSVRDVMEEMVRTCMTFTNTNACIQHKALAMSENPPKMEPRTIERSTIVVPEGGTFFTHVAGNSHLRLLVSLTVENADSRGVVFRYSSKLLQSTFNIHVDPIEKRFRLDYDGKGDKKLLEKHGFVNPSVQPTVSTEFVRLGYDVPIYCE